jgi:hypothetical protein
MKATLTIIIVTTVLAVGYHAIRMEIETMTGCQDAVDGRSVGSALAPDTALMFCLPITARNVRENVR